MVWLVEASNSRCKCLKLCLTTWDVSWRLDAVHQALFVVLDALPSELTLGHTAIRVSHFDFTTRRHKVLEIARLLLFLNLFLSFAFWQLMCGLDLGLRLRALSLLALGADTIRFLRDRFVVLVLVETLVRNVIVGRGVLHGAVD